jgi:hypothetical protein
MSIIVVRYPYHSDRIPHTFTEATHKIIQIRNDNYLLIVKRGKE